MANFTALNASLQVTIHKIFTNICTCFSSVHANVNYHQLFSLLISIALSNPEFMKCAFIQNYFIIVQVGHLLIVQLQFVNFFLLQRDQVHRKLFKKRNKQFASMMDHKACFGKVYSCSTWKLKREKSYISLLTSQLSWKCQKWKQVLIKPIQSTFYYPTDPWLFMPIDADQILVTRKFIIEKY